MALIKEILRTMDYGPSPEGASTSGPGSRSTKAASVTSSRCASPSPATLFDVFNPATGERIAARDQGRRPTSTRRSTRRARLKPNGRSSPATSGAKHLYALARHVQKRERFLAVLETIDNGKPIRETRDIDIPLVARHFYHHAGWASLIESEFPGTSRSASAGRSSRGISAADAGLEDRARARGRQHGRAEARRVYAADRARLRRESASRRDSPRASSTSSPATARPARRSSRMRASTRSPSPARPRSAAKSARRPPAPARSCRSSSAASRRSSCSRMPISTARSRAWSTRSGSTRARCAARARGCWCRRASRGPLREAARAHGEVARRRSARQVDRHGRDRRPGPTRAHQALVRRGREGGREFWRRRDAAGQGLLLSADAVHRSRAGLDLGAGGNFWPGAGVDDLSHA